MTNPVPSPEKIAEAQRTAEQLQKQADDQRRGQS